jgi:hypothetical protein
LGVRASSSELDEVVRRALRAHFVTGLDPPANYSVRLTANDEQHRRGAGFHFLYRGSAPVVRTRSAAAAAGLCQHLAVFPGHERGLTCRHGVALGERGC